MLSFLLAFAFAAPTNVILFIGDGMGPSVVAATRTQYVGHQEKLSFEKFSHFALVKTASYDNHVTDSAAAATAMASGQKTNNGAVGLGPNKEKLQTIVDVFKKKNPGAAVGIVTTTTVTHATPAAFYAHSVSRNNDEEIAAYLFKEDLDLVFGGATPALTNLKNDKKFHLIKTRNEMLTHEKGPVLGLFNNGHLPFSDSDKFDRKTHPTLTEMSLAALKLLTKNTEGFFLMIEGGRIDHALHNTKIPTALRETYEFSKAIQASMDYLAKKNLSDKTLVIVTADHDTAGLRINGYLDINKALITNGKIARSEKEPRPVLEVMEQIAGRGVAHTATDVGLYANGPCSESFKGLLQNTDIFKFIKNCINK